VLLQKRSFTQRFVRANMTTTRSHAPIVVLARENESSNYCWVFKPIAHVTVNIGGMRIDERPVIARTARSNPSHQPESDPTESVEHASDREPDTIDLSTWRDAATERVGVSTESTSSAAKTPPPATIWSPSSPPPTTKYVVYVGSGELHAPDDIITLTCTLAQTARTLSFQLIISWVDTRTTICSTLWSAGCVVLSPTSIALPPYSRRAVGTSLLYDACLAISHCSSHPTSPMALRRSLVRPLPIVMKHSRGVLTNTGIYGGL
jgi:hypothetical protein